MVSDPLPTWPPPLTFNSVSLGWREWAGLPGFGIPSIKAKLDTGARTSSLHVVELETFHVDGILSVRFVLRPRRRSSRLVTCEAAVIDRRAVTDSGGHRADRWFVRTPVDLAGSRFVTEINLTDRGAMLFPLLLGRCALAGRFGVDAALSYTGPRPSRGAPST